MDKTERLFKEIKETFFNTQKSHDWDHTCRVYNLCMHIGEKEGADIDILKLAALLHDIGREEQDRNKGKICHAEKGAILAERILEKYSFDWHIINGVVHCIETHRFRGNKEPLTKEAKILYDADKLDAIGAIGIGRAFVFAGEVGARVHNKEADIANTESYTEEDTAYREFTVKLKNIKNKMLTSEGRKIAEGRHKFMVEFFDRLNREVDGNL